MSSLPVTHPPKWPLSLASSWPLRLAFSASRIILLAMGLGKQLSNTCRQKHWQQKPAMAVINDSNPYSVLLPLHPLSLIGLSSCHPWPLVWPQNSPLYININLNQQNQFPAKEGPISTTPPSCAPWHVLLPSMASTLEVSL